MTVEPEEVGLRERKRRATRRSIQLAVLRLTAENGLDQVTIDEISRDAGVSPRTFFNYFPTKEASLAGDAPFSLTADAIAAFVEAGPGGDPLGEMLELMAVQAQEDGGIDPELHSLRHRVMNDHPQIFALRIDRMRAFEASIAETVERRLRRDAEKQGNEPVPDTEFAEKARMVGLVTMAVARGSWLAWAEHPDAESLPETIRHSYARLREVVPPLEPSCQGTR
ncbi:TetR family transcriptional regulator [Herbiconiux sp. A18JL235]|uniref:TetR family transcriptional regulator n=1 Tax=Herbiconiux sp. A18JL235 TaxID=3152363 RepID=A0AB39BJC8_9MICO